MVLPTANARPRHIQVDTDGMVWFAEFDAGKIGRSIPRPRRSRNINCPARIRRRALGIDGEHKMLIIRRNTWTSSAVSSGHRREVTEYPVPHAENSMRDFFLDQGRMWLRLTANDRVGYFYLAKWQYVVGSAAVSPVARGLTRGSITLARLEVHFVKK